MLKARMLLSVVAVGVTVPAVAHAQLPQVPQPSQVTQAVQVPQVPQLPPVPQVPQVPEVPVPDLPEPPPVPAPPPAPKLPAPSLPATGGGGGGGASSGGGGGSAPSGGGSSAAPSGGGGSTSASSGGGSSTGGGATTRRSHVVGSDGAGESRTPVQRRRAERRLQRAVARLGGCLDELAHDPAARARAARRRRRRPAADAARRRAGAGHPRQAGVAAGTPRAAQCTRSRTQRRLRLGGRERRDERARERTEPGRTGPAPAAAATRPKRAPALRRPTAPRTAPTAPRPSSPAARGDIARAGAARLREWRRPARVGDRDQPVGRGGADAARRPRRLRHPVAARPAPRGPARERRTSVTGRFHSALRSAAPA